MNLEAYDERITKAALRLTQDLNATEIGDLIGVLRIIYNMKIGQKQSARKK